ncbi:uncharacterized protein METZ01_LOCUS272591, partial [marine metagenome]
VHAPPTVGIKRFRGKPIWALPMFLLRHYRDVIHTVYQGFLLSEATTCLVHRVNFCLVKPKLNRRAKRRTYSTVVFVYDSIRVPRTRASTVLSI